MPTTITCTECTARMTLKGEAPAGGKVKCPKCGAVNLVGGPIKLDTPARNRPKPAGDDGRSARARRAVVALEDGDDEDDRPRRNAPAGTSNKGLIIGLGVGFGALAIVVVILLVVLVSRGKTEANPQAVAAPPAVNPPAVPGELPKKKADDPIKPAPPAPQPAAPAERPDAVTAANEYEAVFDDGSRSAAKSLKAPDTFFFGPLTMDSKGRVVSRLGMAGRVTKDTKIAMGVFDEQKKKWVPGAAIEGGYGADLFKDMGKALRIRVTVGDGKVDKPLPGERELLQILVTNTDWKLVYASGDTDAIFKGLGRTNFGGRVAASFVRVELDEQGRVIKYLGEFITSVTQDTKVFMGKYNEKEKTWEAGAAVDGGLWSFKDPGLKPIFVRITNRADGRGIAQILVLQIGEPGKK